jgi:hypothetical protein
MKIISLGYHCYIKSLIKLTDYNKESDIFDWLHSFEFSKLIKSIDNKLDILNKIIKSPISVDLKLANVYFNEEYSFRLPHETNIHESILKYKRRFERFIGYKNTNENYLFLRVINTGRYDVSPELIENNYNEKCFNDIMLHLPLNSKILLFTHCKMSKELKDKIYNKFYLVDDVMSSEHVFFGSYLKDKNKIIQCYKLCFEYIDKNFENFDTNTIYEFIKNEHIGI